MTQEIPWKIGGGKITVNIADTGNWKIKKLSISSTPNTGVGRSQEITVTLSRFPSIKKSFLVYQPGTLSYDGAIASTPNGDYTRVIDCSTSDSVFGSQSKDKLYDGGSSNV